MAAEPDRIRSEIEMTRSELAADVDRLADHTSPSRMMRRGRERMGSRVRAVRDRVMGTPAAAGRSLQDAAHRTADATRDVAGRTADVAEDATEAVREVPEKVAEQTRGNPLAAGLIAFGAGLLVATLLPETRMEQDAARRLSDSDLAGQIRQPVAQAASELRQGVAQDVQDSAREVGQTAKDAAKATAEDARSAVQEARES